MIALSFRTKLLLAMMALVLGVTVTTLLIMENRVRGSYERHFQNLFQIQIDSFMQQREARLAPVKERLAQAAINPRLIAAMEIAGQAGSEQQDVDDLYQNGLDQLLELLRSSRRFRPNGLAAGAGARVAPEKMAAFREALAAQGRLGPQGFFIFLSPTGEVLRPSPKVQLSYAFPGLRRVAAQVAAISQSVSSLGSQQVGYLAPEEEGGLARLREVVFTPIIDQVTRQAHGVLVVGFPLPDEEEREMREISRMIDQALTQNPAAGGILSGIWLDDRLYSSFIPSRHLPDLQREISAELKTARRTRHDFVVEVGAVPHRVFWRALNPDSAFPAAYQVCLYSLAGAEEEKRLLRWLILGSGSVALIGALLLSLLLSHGLAVPLEELAAGTAEIERGNYQVKVPVRSRDEIGHLANSFNEMAEGLALKEKYRSVLNMVADKGVAEELVEGKIALGGELREISVLFCDIRGFTAMTQGMPPTEVIQMLNEHMTALTAVVYECGGVVDKFVGDLIMALFGAPRGTGQDAANAARCALRMIEERAKLNRVSPRPIEIGIGIATGQAVAGCMGSADRLNYTVLGERVNLASRLCGQAGRMEVVIDQETRDRLGDTAEVVPLPELKLKGFSGVITAYKLSSISAPVGKQ